MRTSFIQNSNWAKYSNPIAISVANVASFKVQQLMIIGDHQGFSDELYRSDDGKVFADTQNGCVLVVEFENVKFKIIE